MNMLDLSPGKQAILQDSIVLERLPPEILQIIRLGDGSDFLNAIAAASLIPALTLRLFARFESIFADTCARWITASQYEAQSIIEAFARILSFAPHLSVYLKRYLQQNSKSTQIKGQFSLDFTLQYLSGFNQDENSSLSEPQLQRLLLAVLRLLKFDKQMFSKSVSISKMQNLLQHSNRTIRFLGVKILCCLLSASDAKLDEMVDRYIGRNDPVIGDLDGLSIDYGFLELFEEKAIRDVEKMRNYTRDLTQTAPSFHPKSFSRLVAKYDNLILPRPDGRPSRSSSLIHTASTSKNLRSFAEALLSDSPILVHGLSGSGKTSLVNDFARELVKDAQMVTLHLNEQTDAKMLIGMYVTGSNPGSFTWRPGVLTSAVREGRWVFIEDLDRAPNEVISVILPLIERREILIPSRAEAIQAAPEFRLIASIRTSLNINGSEITPATHMLGARLWRRVPVNIPCQEEFIDIINGIYPILHKLSPGILAVYGRLYALSRTPSFASKNRTSVGRPINLRDLLKWCRRLDAILVAAGSKNGEEPISERTKEEVFMEAADCFASSLQTHDSRKSILYSIAEEMHIPAQRIEHYLDAYVPRYEDSESYLQIGRVKISKRKRHSRVTKSSLRPRPFANTAHAKRLLEQVGVALKMREPVLLVGETGIGKTTVIQQLADSLGHNLTVVNLSQQSEIGDLLGGYKPVNMRSLAIPLKEEFDELFSSTGISASKNQKYLEQLGKCVAKGQWSKASKLWHEAPRMFEKITLELSKSYNTRPKESDEQPPKRRKVDSRLQTLLKLKPRWDRFTESLDTFDMQLSGGSKGFAFTFVEGNIVKAVRNGDWVLLDEVNLASPDIIESIADLLHDGSDESPSILLTETGQMERIQAHPDFRVFGAMNPATDVGKKDLPIGLRSRFTEIYVESPERNLDDLLSVIKAYLRNTSNNDERAAHDIARLYLNTKRLAGEKRLVDGANQVPHYSLRTLTRVLGYAATIAPSYGLRRALYEGYAMGFLTLLDGESERMLMPLINHHLLESHGNPRSILSQAPRHPQDGRQYVRFMDQKRDRQYWMLQGCETLHEQPQYIITPFVERNLLNLVRATSTRKFPILVQGPTSSGKTSMIEYLAKFSGNKFVRINNHEHTDLQEYLGSYLSGPDGQLRFQEGILVQALREGHWIVLDELNLAPSDVLEALNRLLDDNRELLIPETQEIVRPHQNFMLFATQNPPGLYGGRKSLSRAFRNRFLELHFDDIPEDELEYILENRSQNIAPSDCKRIVAVYKELARLRQSNRLFEQKDSFATLRDLFRWASRDAENREQLAANGYMLLAERVRRPEDRVAVKEIIETIMKVKIEPSVLYTPSSCPEIQLYNQTLNTYGIVWNKAMRRLYVLVAHALRNNEPVLLVGETGCGKTTVCQMLADAFGKDLQIVNAHQNTETGDLIGAQRPIRNRMAIARQLEEDLVAALGQDENRELSNLGSLDLLIAAYQTLPNELRTIIPTYLLQRIESGLLKSKALFEWADGSLVQAMKEGHFYLLDEISLADDSVLERLNSVLESERTLLLAEKGAENSFIQAVEGFQFLATMNPGGDYGKRELSPALRNRFTEIWVPSLSDEEDILQIVEAKLSSKFKHFGKAMVEFAEWFGSSYRSSKLQSISVRDMLAWTTFVNTTSAMTTYSAILHGAAMIYIDTLGANPAALLAIDPTTVTEERKKCLNKLCILLNHDITPIYTAPISIQDTNLELRFGDFCMSKLPCAGAGSEIAFEAPITKVNAMRVVRALHLQKPILIEGNPGVGKTTLIVALAQAIGKPLTRINLSEQTDLMDLFGSDVPVEGAEAGHFAWRDAPFLQAMQSGDWVLLDEMNLASQSVLEGLNACLDHRGTVYISELDQTFKRHPEFRVFAAQNPHHQGGGRKGLPSSFVNRFTVVYADIFKNEDLTLICRHSFPAISEDTLCKIISFVSILERDVVHQRRFGSQGGPWEFNLRDSLRWLQLLTSSKPLLSASQPTDFLDILFRQRFRTIKDREEMDKISVNVFGINVPLHNYFHDLSIDAYQVGMAYIQRHPLTKRLAMPVMDTLKRLPELESIMMCIGQCIPCILVGPSGSGKTTLIQHIAAAAGTDLIVFALNHDVDTMDLVGGYEQVDPQREIVIFLTQLRNFIETRILSSLPNLAPLEALEVLSLCQNGKIGSNRLFSDLCIRLLTLQHLTSIPEIGDFAARCKIFMNRSDNIQTARFEWVDGVLVKALEEGKWLVLDNANLCSSSVLDRLNSLLEPNGFLSINEHCGTDGQSKIVKPHPNFRLFMTMDPRFGELSRAMRNRAVEIYIELDDNSISRNTNTNRDRIHDSDAFLGRYRRLVGILQNPPPRGQIELLAGVALDHLSRADTSTFRRFSELALNGLVEITSTEILPVLNQHMKIIESEEYGYLRNAIQNGYARIEDRMHLLETFKDAQPFHPLQNSPLVPLLKTSSGSDQTIWLGALMDFHLDILSAYNANRSQAIAAVSLKPSQMSRLQRSMCRDRIPAAGKDSTAGVFLFLEDLLGILREQLQGNQNENESIRNKKKIISTIIRIWWETYRLASNRDYEEAVFQAHLEIEREVLARELSITTTSMNNDPDFQEVRLFRTPSQNVIEFVQERIKTYFGSEFQLTTGLSMEKLWQIFRPKAISNSQKLQTLIDMEELGTRFDHLKWKVSKLVSELSAITTSLVEAYCLILTSEVDGSLLVKTLGSEISALEAGTTVANSPLPFFSAQFQALVQYEIIGNVENSAKELATLASKPTVLLMDITSASNTSIYLQEIQFLWGNNENLFPIEDIFSLSLLKKLHKVGDVELSMLKLLEEEGPILADQISQGAALLGQRQLLSMNLHLLQLLIETIRVHNVKLAHEVEKLKLHITNSTREAKVQDRTTIFNYADQLYDPAKDLPYFDRVFRDHLKPAIDAIISAEIEPEHQMKHSSLAWTHFAVGCIILYVPDRPFDPNCRQLLELEKYNHAKYSIENKITALRTHEKIFTGKDENLRIQLLEGELNDLDEPTESTQNVSRPEKSELNELQGEFNNLLNTAIRADPIDMVRLQFDSADERSAQHIKLLVKNVSQISHRLSRRFRGYGDITVPVNGMLQCLLTGLHMAGLASASISPNDFTIKNISSVTPFLGGTPEKENLLLLEQPLDVLAIYAMIGSVEGLDSLNDDQRQLFLGTVHSCYNDWSKKLEVDRKEAESKSGLYRFRGGVEDDQEHDKDEFNELFPDFYQDSAHPTKSQASYSTRDAAVDIASVHSKIVSEESSPTEDIIFVLRQMSGRIGTIYDDHVSLPNGSMTRNLLPGVLIKLSDHMEELKSSSAATDSYNFYTDMNLLEARNLVLLIQQVQKRFQDLQNIDEIGHMQPLQDVMVSCQELLRYRHTEPLASLIPKVEKVHAYMHEWQFGGWASRANSVITLYDKLTSTIVSWRRLELATWAKLFDMEDRKCSNDAKSWWFIAYEVVIAVPLSISRSELELRSYARKLLQDLEIYFVTAIQGQFTQRLRLLKQLQRHLGVIMIEFPLISIVRDAVMNFIGIYARYEEIIMESLRRGRLILEKAMQDVILLASWKDTNIIALRDSAHRSHHKLFKIVRKYRGLLGLPVEQILKNGIPDENGDSNWDVTRNTPIILPSVDTRAMSFCQSQIPHWSGKSKRHLNASKTVTLMDKTAQVPSTAFDAVQYLESFLNNFISSTGELRKATPLILTEETKNTVKHLKSRKRKLFADTLKELRQMGIKHNLGSAALSKQESLSAMLTNCKYLQSVEFLSSDSIDVYYHKALEFIPQARSAQRQHSEDLSNVEVSRSTGLLEGLLQVLLKQRNSIAAAVADSHKLSQTIRKVQALWAPGKYDIIHSLYHTNHKSVLRWLPNILRVGSELVKILGSGSKIDITKVQRFLSLNIQIFDDFGQAWETLPSLPAGFDSTALENLRVQIDDAIGELRSDLDVMCEDIPQLRFILQQIQPWSVINRVASSKLSQNYDISLLDWNLSQICDSILVAIENFATSAGQLPNSTEDPAWLVSSDNSHLESTKSLHIRKITVRINKTLELISNISFEDEFSGKTIGAVFAVALPIFQEYNNIVQQSIIRYASLHRATCKMTYILAKAFTEIASHGFCTPSEKSDAQEGKTEKLEAGTGLGEGEGADDISKDIQDDEDLSELAQEPDKRNDENFEDEKDAVDMADGDMEGEINETQEKKEDETGSGDDESEVDDMEEEAGDVDDLDPNAIDEKLWDGDREEAEKQQEDDKSKGKKNNDEQVAAEDNDNQKTEGDEYEGEENEPATEQDEVLHQGEVEKHDPHAQEGETLELPEEMELDGNNENESASSSDGSMDDLSDVDDGARDIDVEENEKEEDIPEGEETEMQDDQDDRSDLDMISPETGEEQPDNVTKDADEKVEEDLKPDDKANEDFLRDRLDDTDMVSNDIVPSEVQGSGENQEENQADDIVSTSKAQREDGERGGEASEQKSATADSGEDGTQAGGEASQNHNEEYKSDVEVNPFKRLGDTLEKWHRQQSQIRDALDEQEKLPEQAMEVDINKLDFQHLQDEEAQADTQALGTATEEQAHALDESMAIDADTTDFPETFQPEEAEIDNIEHDDSDDRAPVHEEEQKPSEAYEGRAGALIREANRDHQEIEDQARAQEGLDLEEDISEVDMQLSTTHIDPKDSTVSRSATNARQLWTHYESLTRDLSLSLTEQLRLILDPTQATKMRGDFRTGKRLNIKRIIPYIASQYKRDKIWMRRSVPSKRNYQIMLAVDDSKSMGESGSGSLALETLVMVSKSLSMLEVGQICIVSFGEDFKVAHDFETSFSNEAGPKVFQNFDFDQGRTNVTELVRKSIIHFRMARAKASNTPSDLWQLELIISDGVCDSSEHEPIRRLLREAIEERIMMVFVIVDDLKTKKNGESVMDLKEAKFVKNEATGMSNVKIERYLDTFPFQYYLIVSDVKELPGVLATLLRQWFAEVADSSG